MRRDSRQSRRERPAADARPPGGPGRVRRGTILLMVVGLLSMLFVIVTAYLTLSRVDRQIGRSVQRADITNQVADGLIDLAAIAIRSQWEDESGDVLAADVPYADTYGPGGATFLSALEPVQEPSGVRNHPGAYRYPQIGTLDSSRPLAGPQSFDDTMEIDEQTRYGVPGQTSRYVSKLRNAGRDPYTDASGIDTVATNGIPDARLLDASGAGMPDSRQAATARATQIANAIAGVAVRVPTENDPHALLKIYGSWDLNHPPLTTQERDALISLARRFEANARYDIATRIVSNGGKLSLYSPEDGAGTPLWNRAWVTAMFNHIRHPNDTVVFNPSNPAHNRLLNDVAENAAAVEALLARRGGLLPSWLAPGANDDERTVIAVQRQLEGLFPRTLANPYTDFAGRAKPDRWQRFNLGTISGIVGVPPLPGIPNEWDIFRFGSTLGARDYNHDATGSGVLFQAMVRYDRRHSLTALSYSDDVARKQVRQNPAATDRLGVEEGQLKFYLGEITRDASQGGAFELATGNFNALTGRTLIRRLANYYFDMLDGYVGWRGGAGSSEAVTRREQAFQLAVNTVAAAAPRDPATGRTDVVFYIDGGSAKIYAGYGPQPFFTQAIAYYDAEGSGGSDHIALGVEIYNPNDDDAVGSYALDLTQFGISLNNQYETDSTLLRPFPANGRERLAGRSFATFSIQQANSEFDGDPNGVLVHSITDLAIDSDTQPSGAEVITIKLWKFGSSSPYLVDQIELDVSGLPTTTTDPSDRWFVDVRRDTQPETYLGTDASARAPRWRMLIETPHDDSQYGVFFERQTDADPDITVLGVPGGPLSAAAGPTIPLIMMNPPLSSRSFMGVPRPSAFPTVGFLLFVPRFTHIADVSSGAAVYKPMTRVLHEQFRAQSGNSFTDANGNGRLDEVAADFGHMPVLDNRQDVRGQGAPLRQSDSSFVDERLGRVPWGLLVFDYFTTINPRGRDDIPGNEDDIDPRKIPGRLNVNAAPWYLLAGLPIIDPTNAAFIDRGASPAFWDTSAGMLTGLGDDVRPRFIGVDENSGNVRTTPIELPYFDSSIGTYRLGPHLAQAAAAYRDRLQYVDDDPLEGTAYWEAHKRNGTLSGVGTFTPYRDNAAITGLPPRYGQIRGAGTSGPFKAGFLSLGELLNVAGFDATPPDGPNSRVLRVPSTADEGDFLKSVSLLALLDTHFLTTRSNTFTAYVTVTDRENAQASVRSQATLDRSNLVPRVLTEDELNADTNGINGIERGQPALLDTLDAAGLPGTDGIVDTPAVLRDRGLPRILSERRIGYYNARYDE